MLSSCAVGVRRRRRTPRRGGVDHREHRLCPIAARPRASAASGERPQARDADELDRQRLREAARGGDPDPQAGERARARRRRRSARPRASRSPASASSSRAISSSRVAWPGCAPAAGSSRASSVVPSARRSATAVEAVAVSKPSTIIRAASPATAGERLLDLDPPAVVAVVAERHAQARRRPARASPSGATRRRRSARARGSRRAGRVLVCRARPAGRGRDGRPSARRPL